MVSDQLINIVDEGIDFGIRFNEQVAQDMIALPFAQAVRLHPFATPQFIEKFGQPQTIDDLSNFNCIQRKFSSGALYAWEFMLDGKRIEKKVIGDLTFNTDQMIIDAGLTHLGIIYVYDDLVQQHVANGRLQPLLTQYACPKAPFYLYYSSKKYQSTALKLFIEWIKNGGCVSC